MIEIKKSDKALFRDKYNLLISTNRGAMTCSYELLRVFGESGTDLLRTGWIERKDRANPKYTEPLVQLKKKDPKSEALIGIHILSLPLVLKPYIKITHKEAGREKIRIKMKKLLRTELKQLNIENTLEWKFFMEEVLEFQKKIHNYGIYCRDEIFED